MKMKPNKGVQGTAHKVRCPLTPDVRSHIDNNKKGAMKNDSHKLEVYNEKFKIAGHVAFILHKCCRVVWPGYDK